VVSMCTILRLIAGDGRHRTIGGRHGRWEAYGKCGGRRKRSRMYGRTFTAAAAWPGGLRSEDMFAVVGDAGGKEQVG